MASDSLDIKEDLCNYLQVIGSGKYATSGLLSTAKNPGLFVEGIGKIGLPLSDRDAADLSRVSHEAPFGKGSETFLDPTVRKTWELNPNQFELRNPAWPSTLQEVVGKVAQDLGVVDGASSIHAELHKMLLYEPGAFFDKHRDTEKAPGMFATLVIALPSEHTGGDVIVQLRDEEQTLRTQGLCDFDYSYLAWYADVNHSVSKVESGHRLVLTYNLIRQASNSSQMASVLDDHKQNLNKVLALWSKQDREMESHADYVYKDMVYILEHEYSEANICLDHLKGKDQLRTRYLLEACRDQGFCLFFAHFEYSQSGSIDEDEDDPGWANHLNGANYHEFIDEIESKWQLLTVFQPGGEKIARGIVLEEEEILENTDFTAVEPDDEECDGWTGNEGCTATHFYHRTCAVILPKTRRLDFLSRVEKIHVQEYIRTLLRETQDEILSVASRKELEKFCETVIDSKKMPQKPRSRYVEEPYSFGGRGEASRVPDKELAIIGKATLRLDRPDLLEKVARLTSRVVHLDLFQELGKGLIERDISLWQNGQVHITFFRITIAISHIPNISERVRAMDLLVSSYREAAGNVAAAIQRMQDFEREMSINITETQGGESAMTAADAQTLLQLSQKYGEKYIFQVVLPLAKKNTSNVDFIIAFLTAVFRADEAHQLRQGVAEVLFKELLGGMTPYLQLQYRESGRDEARNEFAKRRRYDYHNHGSQAAEDHNRRLVTANTLAMLFFQCEKFCYWHEIDQLADKIISSIPNANAMTLERLLLPMLKRLPPFVDPSSNSTHSYVKLFRIVIPSYISTYVQSPPQKPTGLDRQPRGCSLHCEDCVKLDDFLKNPERSTAYFQVKTNRRNHLEERLRYSNCSTDTQRSGTPYTLIVKKMGMEWESAMKEWRQRCEIAFKAVEKIGFEKLKRLLGEKWEDIVGLREIKAGAGREKLPLGDLAQAKETSGVIETGVDKKAPGRIGPEIIDLSCE